MTILEYADFRFEGWKKRMREECGYEPLTRLYFNFTRAEFDGAEKIEYAFKCWAMVFGSDYKRFTELVLCLNHKIWEMDDMKKSFVKPFTLQQIDEYEKLYDTLWRKAEDMFYEKWGEDKEACQYYFEVTD